MAKKKKHEFSLGQWLNHLYLILMFGLFPVFCSDGFFNIRHDRYYFFLWCSVVFLVLISMHGAAQLLGRLDDHRQLLPDPVDWVRSLTVTDWAMIGLFLCCFVSTAFSKYPKDAFLGTAGRNHGFVVMAVYVAVYFMISRRNDYRGILFAVLGLTSAFVGLVSVLNYFYLDPLKMLAPLSQADQKIFIATIGNKNLLSSFFCITIPVLTTMFIFGKHQPLGWFCLISAGFSTAGLAVSDSDSGILGIAVFIAVYLIWCSRELLHTKRLCLALTVLLLFVKLVGLIPGECKSTESLHSLMIASPLTTAALIFMVIGTWALYFVHKNNPELLLPKAIRTGLICLFGGCVLFVLLGMVYFTLIAPDAPLSDRWALLRVNDDWGTHRGVMWRRSMEIFGDFPFFNKLFGSGPDTFYHEFKPYFPDLYKYNEGSTNAAHSEYINYLITLGVLGVACYLTAVVSAVVRCVRGWKKDPLCAVFCSAVICYGAQAMVNIAQPITTPLFFLFLALCAGKNNSNR